MRYRTLKSVVVAVLALFGITTLVNSNQAQKPNSNAAITIPKTWDEEMIASLEVPLSNADFSPVHVSADYYYRMPVRPIYKSYPVYHPDKEPAGYAEWLKQQEPEVVFDASKLKTEEDWIKAGKLVFEAPIAYDTLVTVSDVSNPAWYETTGVTLAKDGVMPYLHYVIREKGKIELGNASCAHCHTRVMPDGAILEGAQGNFPAGRAIAFFLRKGTSGRGQRLRRMLFAAPWIELDPLPRAERLSDESAASLVETIPPGVLPRQGTSLFYPPQVPDLIGVKERRYLDHTGLVRHRSIGDLMRYAALNQGADVLARYGDFRPMAAVGGKLPDPSKLSRYSDAQLHALALYIYSLTPPPNPNQFDALAARGKKVFEREGCVMCHTPPLYTSNKLTPVEGFNVPEDHLKKFDILPISVGTDPHLALKTRRGTGYYKVPSLKGVWYRGPFEHNGSVATLEDWFDPRRLKDDYLPTGFKDHDVKTRAVKGHPFGLDLSAKDRQALITFLKSL